MQMMLGHSKTPSKQSIDDMWLKTTHYWINTYRVAATRAQAALENEPPTGNNSAFHDDLNKIHTLFRQGLKNEEVVYRTLILNLVRRWGLEKMVKTPLKALGLKVKFDEAAFDRTIGFSEKKEKIRLVSFALCSLGDMQRYRGQLKQQMGLRPQGTMSSIDNGYARAREYYDCAKAINPDDGTYCPSCVDPDGMLADRCRFTISSTRGIVRPSQGRSWRAVLHDPIYRLQAGLDKRRECCRKPHEKTASSLEGHGSGSRRRCLVGLAFGRRGQSQLYGHAGGTIHHRQVSQQY